MKITRNWGKAATAAMVSLCMLGAVAGCQGSASQSGADANGNTVVKFMNFSSNDGHEKELDAIVKAFEKENPKISIKVETVPYADYSAKLQTAIAGQAEADTFELEYAQFPAMAKSGVLADISDADTSPYMQSLIDSYSQDGKLYALPESFSTVLLFYNKDLFDKADVEYPTNDWTWKEEQAAAEKLTDKTNGIWGDYQPITYNELYKTIVQSGGSFLNDKGDATDVNSKAGKDAVAWLAGKSGKTMPTDADGANTPDFDTNLFTSGKLAMWHTVSWMFSTVKEKAPDMNWDVVVEPGNTQQGSASFSNAVAVSSRSKVQDAAKKWLEFYTASSTTVKQRLDTSWELPPISDETELKPYLEQTPPANRQAVFDSLDKVALAPVLEKSEQVSDTVNNELTAVAAGRESVDDAVTNIQKNVDPLLK